MLEIETENNFFVYLPCFALAKSWRKAAMSELGMVDAVSAGQIFSNRCLTVEDLDFGKSAKAFLSGTNMTVLLTGVLTSPVLPNVYFFTFSF